MICPKCGWHTHNPSVRKSTRWEGCCEYSIHTYYCEKFFCSGKVESKVLLKKDHKWVRYRTVNPKNNAITSAGEKCSKCGEIWDD